MVRLSLVIISWNSFPMLRACLESLQPLLNRTDVELVWVDNGSSDESARYVATRFPEAKTKLMPRNMGVAYARNRGVEMSQGEYVMFLDDDTEVSSGTIERLLDYMDAHLDTGLLGCALRDSNGNLQDSFKGYPGLWCKVRNVIRSKFGKGNIKTELPETVIYPVYVIGACQLVRREVFDCVGLLDEKIFYGPEDADFCIRTRKAGWKVAYFPEVSILHHWRRITSRSLTSRSSRMHMRGLLHFWCKHRRL